MIIPSKIEHYVVLHMESDDSFELRMESEHHGSSPLRLGLCQTFRRHCAAGTGVLRAFINSYYLPKVLLGTCPAIRAQHIQFVRVGPMLQHRVELICRSHRGPQGAALHLFTAIACGVHTNFTAPYGVITVN